MALIASGMMVSTALAAAVTLADAGVSAGVVNVPVIKPLDRATIIRAAANATAVITAENHSVIGGLGSAVAEVLAEAGLARPLRRVGLQDTFAEGAQSAASLFLKYGLGTQDDRRPGLERAGAPGRIAASDARRRAGRRLLAGMTDRALTLGWLGTGRMGSIMARRLLDAGHDLTVWNRTRAKAEPLADAGATVVDRISDLAPCDLVFVMVSTPADLEDVVTGADGLLSATPRRPGSSSTAQAWAPTPRPACARPPPPAGWSSSRRRSAATRTWSPKDRR